MEKECVLDVEVGAFSGPEKSLLVILLVTLPQLGLGSGKDGRQECPMCGFVLPRPQACAPDTTPQGLGARQGQESSPATFSLSRRHEGGGGGAKIAKNSHGLWDLLFPRNQWN